MEPLPDLATLTDPDLKGLIDEYTKEEQEVSYRRRILHGKIDILRAELVARLQKTQGRSVLDQVDVESLTEILAGKAAPPQRMSHIYCPECGFQNPEAANYCAKCGALLHERESESVEQTQSFTAEERDELLETLGDIGVQGPALVVRSGGGRSGETFAPQGERTTIGRSPDCGIFLDDVTVSRKHAELVQKDGRWLVEDQEPQRHLREPKARRDG